MTSSSKLLQNTASLEATYAGRLLGNFLGLRGRNISSSSSSLQTDVAKSSEGAIEPARKFRPLVDKEVWHEAWMYEDRFGTEDNPVIVPSLEPERIIGVTDPDDENLVVWGILKVDEPPRQFIEGGEFYVLKKVPYVKKVGDILDELEASS
jgi:cytochrome c oxidase subunit 5b